LDYPGEPAFSGQSKQGIVGADGVEARYKAGILATAGNGGDAGNEDQREDQPA
jgi:hypothetical protein